MMEHHRPLSLHQLTALDVSPLALVHIAADLGCDHVGLFTFVPPRGQGVYPAVTRDDVPALRAAMADRGVTCCNLEVFPLDGAEDWAAFARALEIGASLGATRATVQPHDADRAVAAERIARFCDLAAPYGIVAGLEFNRFSAVEDITTATAIVRAVDRPNAGVVLDMLHLVRFGDDASSVAQARDLIGYVQLNDGPLRIADEDRWHEAVRERGVPGSGEFPIVTVLRALGPGLVFDVEVPQTRSRKAGVPAAERARAAVEGARAVLHLAYEGASA